MKQFIFLFLITFSLSAQVKGIVLDSISAKPIAYAAVMYENSKIGINTDENGQFYLKDIDTLQKIEISNLGYNSQIITKANNLKVYLSPKIYEFREIEVYAKFENESTTLGTLAKSNNSYGNGGAAHMWGKYFFNNKVDKKFRFLKEVKFITKSQVKNAKLKIRIFTIDSIGKINNNLLEEELIITCKKGKQMQTVDVSMYNISFPKVGLMIAFESLIIEENKFEYNYTMEGEKEKFKGVSYQPSIVGFLSEQPEVYSINNDNAFLLKNKAKNNKKYHDLSVQITLTN